jgi:hypothetical protein
VLSHALLHCHVLNETKLHLDSRGLISAMSFLHLLCQLESIVPVPVLLVVLMFYRALARTNTHIHTYLATGPCFMLYNGMLRGGRGFCGEVPALKDVEFGSEEFRQLLRAKTVADRMENAGHKFSSTMHVLASAIKKIQGIAEDGQGTRLYRGLGKLPTQLFTKP